MVRRKLESGPQIIFTFLALSKRAIFDGTFEIKFGSGGLGDFLSQLLDGVLDIMVGTHDHRQKKAVTSIELPLPFS